MENHEARKQMKSKLILVLSYPQKLNTNGISCDKSSVRINQRQIDTFPCTLEYESFLSVTEILNVLISNYFSKDTPYLHLSMLPSKDWYLSNQTIKVSFTFS